MLKLTALFLLALVASGCDGGGVIRDGALTAPGLLLGERVALSGDVALLGAPASNDAVVFERGPDGWDVAARLGPTEARVPDPFFGQYLDLDGDFAVLGAPENDVALDAPGHAYVYARAGGGWVEEAVLRPGDLAPNANFGNGVSVSGGTVAVAAGDDEVGEDRTGGRVHVFERDSGAWSRTAVLTHPDPGPGTGFGGDVAVDGEYLAVDGSASRREGRVFIFMRDVTGRWAIESTVMEPVTEGSSGGLSYGLDIELDGSTLAVNSPGVGGGTVYVYRRSALGWSLEATLVRSREELGGPATFGFRIALSGDRLVASVPGREIDGRSRGSAIVYVRNADGTWTEEAELQLDDPASGFGRDVDIDGDTVIVGANNGDSVGGAYLFRRGPDGWALAP